ncbi:hypothetical protein [Arthrobacter sp. ISL-95]|uniref:hypothetical protein n=1 Tax=Arthrobacter sp. ISL-95 TaxID=2819116 RepID=UPI001BE66627|nr:hypothetical protein [Arthrobacter sp. ISL-95]MBT2585601.1 hypothetical protein [Arthrobacter sp. ISL-95]
MEPRNPYPANYVPPQPGQVLVPLLPAWARTFRSILLILAGLLVLLLMLLFWAATSGSSAGGLGILQVIFWLGFGLFWLAIPYVPASILYAVLWASKLRGNGYRRYPGTSWILIVGPILAGLILLSLIGLIAANPISL